MTPLRVDVGRQRLDQGQQLKFARINRSDRCTDLGVPQVHQTSRRTSPRPSEHYHSPTPALPTSLGPGVICTNLCLFMVLLSSVFMLISVFIFPFTIYVIAEIATEYRIVVTLSTLRTLYAK